MLRIATGIMAAVLAAAGFADSGERRAGRVAMPVVKIEQGEACVAATEEMRRDHMKMLLHQRDRTMRQGLRETRFSLKNCVECHASRETGSVLGKDGFCSSCHAYASVRMDCFECHTPLRQGRTAGAPR
ncbi:MAG: Hdr-like menaquinol oxidoreductase cytochrome c subunit [Betaproteobacteria bacterium]|nr:Hdr-like menaquinol oxidoreductase cytochrome c subunit [Betaproteobacteria bacterium]